MGRKSYRQPFEEAHEGLLQYLQTVAAMQRSMKVAKGVRSAEMLVLEHGRIFRPPSKRVPHGLRRREVKQCFSNSQMLLLEQEVWDNPLRLTYYEGFAASIIPIQHGWLVDRDGKVIDVTLREPASAYIGVPIKTEYVREMMYKTGYLGSLFENWHHKPAQPIVSGLHKEAEWLETGQTHGEKAA